MSLCVNMHGSLIDIVIITVNIIAIGLSSHCLTLRLKLPNTSNAIFINKQ